MSSYRFDLRPVKTEPISTKHRKIITDIPSPNTINIIETCLEKEPYSMNNQLPIVWDRAIDYKIYDNSGNCWIDFTSCIFVTNVGHANPKVVEAINRTINKGLLNAYYYPTQERADFVKLLIDITPKDLNKVLFLSTGSEAVEAALKASKIYSQKRKSIDKSYIIGFEKSFHGKTMGSQLAGSKEKEKQWINNRDSQTAHLPFPYPWVLEKSRLTGKEFFHKTIEDLKFYQKINNSDIAAVISEPYQGWCAVFLPKDYAQALRDWCTDNDVVLIIDEVQSGFGRTGKLFAYEHFEIEPDIIVCGKGISSSLPLSAVIAKEKIIDTDESFNSTHGGNPVAVAASLASTKFLLENNLIEESKRKGKILQEELEKWQKEMPEYIEKIYCQGLLASVFINSPKSVNGLGCQVIYSPEFVDLLIERAMRKGLMSVRTCSGTLKIGPPLTIPDDALIEGIEVLKESLKEEIERWK